MLVILASARDSAARVFASRASLRLLTPRDLSCSGWRCGFGSTKPSSGRPGAAVLGGEVFPAGAIDGVITRLPWISTAEIDHVAEADRAYVAAEMHAFLFAWLSRLACPVVNRPTPHCLSGPAWRNEHWIHTAASVGIPVRVARRSATPGARFQPAPPLGAIHSVTVVGGEYAGYRDASLREKTGALAAAAGCAMLTANYEEAAGGIRLLDVSLWPDLADAAIQDLVLGHFADRRAVA